MATGSRATFVISWAQTEADGDQPALPALMTAGVSWRWSGEAMRVDAPRDILLLENALGMADIRQRASRMIGRLTGMPSVPGPVRALRAALHGAEASDAPSLAGQCFVVTDGVRCWTATVVQGQGDLSPADPAGWLLAFAGAMPPKDRDLWLVRSRVSLETSRARGGVICFTGGTRILTPSGQVAVETLRPGDLVITRDNGAQEVIWTGQRHMSGARLHAMPHLRPIRICDGALGDGGFGEGRPDGDLLVSPSHRILMQGRVAQALFNCDEVLVRAHDLVDDHRIRADLALREVTYHHILLGRHEVVFANGLGADSFHPGEAEPAGLDRNDYRSLCALLPGVAEDPMSYGGFARRGLTPAEAALFFHEARG
ncbi:Hint domain-containing protein [Rhodobacter sp. 24-YEA-8]|nr:Hint domain-containing protein [Rhodobacter sp. 24-YEA-8]